MHKYNWSCWIYVIFQCVSLKYPIVLYNPEFIILVVIGTILKFTGVKLYLLFANDIITDQLWLDNCLQQGNHFQSDGVITWECCNKAVAECYNTRVHGSLKVINWVINISICFFISAVKLLSLLATNLSTMKSTQRWISRLFSSSINAHHPHSIQCSPDIKW